MNLVCPVFALRNRGGKPWKGAVVGETMGTYLEFIIYNRETVWPLPLVPGRQPLNPWNVPSVIYGRSLGPHLMVYASKVTQEGGW